MALKKSRRSPGYVEQLSAPARLIYERMEELGMRQSDLAFGTGISKVKISRLFRNTGKAGDTYTLTERDINLISIVLKWGKSGRDKLRYAVWPELACFDAALENHEGIVRLNCRLDDNGLPLIDI